MAKSDFTKGHKVHVIKTDLDSIETKHAKHVAAKTDAKRLPYCEIHHDPDTNSYHVSTRNRESNGTVAGHGEDTVHTEKTFLHHVLHLHRDHPKMQPFPTEASIKTKPNGHVDLHVSHPAYGAVHSLRKYLNKQKKPE